MTDKSDVENEDKKIIGDEEREKMLNAENIIREEAKEKMDEIGKENELEKEKEAESEKERDDKDENGTKTGEVEKMKKQLEESQKESLGRIRVPIGGIRIPGFLRSRSKDKNKDGDGTVEEGADLLETGEAKPEVQAAGLRATLQRGLDTLSARNPFAKKEPVEGAEPQPRLLDRIKLPPINLPKRFRKDQKPQDVEQGAELASAETLEDGKPASPDDGMESVKLDGDDKVDEKSAEKAEEKKIPIHIQLLERYQKLSKHEKAIGGAIILLLLLIIIVVIATTVGPHPTAPPIINGKVVTTTQCGPVEGLQEGEAFVFRGIPYAVPPLGVNRWKPAQELNNLKFCWNDTFHAHNSSRHCWKVNADNMDGYEDCLYLDIFTPEVRYINPVPVVVLIDAVTILGGPSGILQPTTKLVHSREVVFVRPNFRLGLLGFLAATPFHAAVHPPTSGNYGLSDIIVALKWINANIANFGGDAKSITVLGHRAGATLVTALATSPAAKGLFTRAWAASGSSIFPGDALQASEYKNSDYIHDTCPESSNAYNCLSTTNVEALLANVDEYWNTVKTIPSPDEESTIAAKPEWLVLDGKILQTHVLSENAERHAKLVVGTTAQSEANDQVWAATTRLSDRRESIKTAIESSAVGKYNLTEEALARYNMTFQGLASLVSDIRTVCPLQVMARAQPNVTFYVATLQRNHTDYGELADVDMDVSAIMGRYEPHSPPQQQFVSTIQNIFYRFVETGELPPGPSRAQSLLEIARTAEWKDDYPNCNFWIEKNIVPKFARRD